MYILAAVAIGLFMILGKKSKLAGVLSFIAGILMLTSSPIISLILILIGLRLILK